jgi:hypothetical protein
LLGQGVCRLSAEPGEALAGRWRSKERTTAVKEPQILRLLHGAADRVHEPPGLDDNFNGGIMRVLLPLASRGWTRERHANADHIKNKHWRSRGNADRVSRADDGGDEEDGKDGVADVLDREFGVDRSPDRERKKMRMGSSNVMQRPSMTARKKPV